MGHTQDAKKFFGRNKKSRSSAFRKFLFYQNICFDWVMNLFLSWVMFSVKKVSFPAKTAVWVCTQTHQDRSYKYFSICDAYTHSISY